MKNLNYDWSSDLVNGTVTAVSNTDKGTDITVQIPDGVLTVRSDVTYTIERVSAEVTSCR